jgi:hypothetical protein
LEACPEFDQKALEVCTPLVQNGADEHGPGRGDITAEWAHIGRLNGVIGEVDSAQAQVAALSGNAISRPLTELSLTLHLCAEAFPIKANDDPNKVAAT